jgi:hypothetical protein
MKKLLLIASFIFTGVIYAQSTASFFKKADLVFNAHVKGNKVDYKAIFENPELLNVALQEAKDISISSINSKTYQAFWINTYNLLVIKGIVDAYPIMSPLEVNGFFDTSTYSVGGKKVTLNDIENKLLREKFPNEPRFHFVLVCGALSCPPIIDHAYSPNFLDKQLQEQTVKAINNPKFLRVNETSVAFSQIMEWYNEDFTKNDQTLIEFSNAYRKEKIALDAKVSFYPYDWTLNDVKN